MRRITACILGIVLLISGCSFTAFAQDEAPAAEYAYPQMDVLEIDLYIQPYHYLQLTHSRERKKHPAVVSINGESPCEIAVRVRGAMSLEDGMNFASKRIPLEFCFDYADPDGKFRDNASLKLINCYTPAKLLTQLIAMQTFRFLGIPSPRVWPAFLRINDVDFGLYLAVEDLNEDFVRSHFGTGTLFRRFNAREIENGEDATEDAKIRFENTDMKVKVDHGTETIRQYEESRSRGESIERYVDADAFLRYFACEMFLFNKDGIQHLKNCYFLEHDGKISVLPWDLSEAFCIFREEWPDDEDYADYEKRYINGTELYRQLMQNDDYFKRYRRYIRQINDEFMDPDVFLPWLEQYIQDLSVYFQRDNTIGLRSEHIAQDLTTGTEIYNGMAGNLLLTFRAYHDETNKILSGQAKRYSVPEGMHVVLEDSMTSEDEGRIFGTDHSIVFRICRNYWKLRRQVYMQEYGTTGLAIGVVFAAVFILTVISVRTPKGKKPRGSPARKKVEHER